MIPLGYELGSGKRVSIPVNHTVVLGQTQLSGKTTTMEAMVTRSGLRAIGFITKPGEKSFRLQTKIPAFFSESTQEEYWKHIVAMLEYGSEVKLGWRERGVVIKLCQDYGKESSRIAVDTKGKSKRERVTYSWKAPKTLKDFLANVNAYQKHARGNEEMICIQLREFLQPAIREIERTEFSDKLQLSRGINVMDITDLSDGLKALVIRSVIMWIHKHGRKIVVIIPEAWKFIPEGRSTPVKLALEGLIREGAGVENFVWMDSQDLRGVDKMLLRSVIVWLFGVQRQKNEVASTLASIPDHPKPSATEIMQLGRGEFYVSYGNTLVRTYVQPAGMEDTHAEAIALGDEKPESWKAIAASLDEENRSVADSDESQGQSGGVGGDPGEDAGGVRRAAGDVGPSMRGAGDRSHEIPGAKVAANAVDGSDDEMWKQKYEELKSSYDNLVEAHDALALQVKELLLEKSPASQVGHAETAAEASPFPNTPTTASAAPKNGDLKQKVFIANLEEQIRTELFRMAKNDPQAVAVIAQLAQTFPELKVTKERRVMQMNSTDTYGRIALLLSENFFDNPRNQGEVTKEFKRRGWFEQKTSNAAVIKPMAKFTEWGFFTNEADGYQAVPGMKVNVVEVPA
jgi:hypothetical protein